MRTNAVMPAASTRPTAARVRLLIAAVAAFGLCGSLWFFGPGLLDALATLTRASVAVLVVYAGYSCAVLVLLGAAWAVAAGEPARAIGVFAWARIVREAAADLLPFSQVGAIVISFRIVLAGGVDAAVVYASFIADLTTELGSQLLFVLCGLTVLWIGAPASGDRELVFVGLALGIALLVALAAAFASAYWTLPLAQRLIGVAMPGAAAALAATRNGLVAVYRHRSRVATTFLLNLIGWFASAFGVWLALRWVGIDVPPMRIVALESLICVLRSVAFAIPAGIGVQEAGYGLLGPLLGLPLEAALSIALLKRLRDVIVALPVLLIWQASQFSGLSTRPGSRP